LPFGADFSVAPTWTWYVPQDAYPSGGTGSGEISFPASAMFLFNNGAAGDPGPFCNVPFPFSAWTVNKPVLSSLGPASTQINGGQFTITGQYLYPGSVVAVLIGGNPVSLSSNVDLVDDTTIEVVVPGGYVPGTYSVQVNTEFSGQTRFSNELVLTLTN
jgi:IPT/TIG domain-containing protein